MSLSYFFSSNFFKIKSLIFFHAFSSFGPAVFLTPMDKYSNSSNIFLEGNIPILDARIQASITDALALL